MLQVLYVITRKRESEIELKLKIEGHNNDDKEEEEEDRMYGKTTGKIRNRRRRSAWAIKRNKVCKIQVAAARKLSSSIIIIVIAMQKLLQSFSNVYIFYIFFLYVNE